MAEMRMSSVLMIVVVLVVAGALVAGFTGYLSIGWFNKENLNKAVDQGLGAAAGFTAAKTPQEAMDKFREAIEGRNYTYAAKYCTKDYSAILDRSAVGAAKLGGELDRIREYGKNKGLLTEKTTFLLHQLDPFPKNLKSGNPPQEKAGKTYGAYNLEATTFSAPMEKLVGELVNLDKRMFQTVLAPRPIFASPIELVKEGEEWKLNIITNPVWEGEVAYFNDNWKSYHTALESFRGSMLNGRYATSSEFEEDIVDKLRKTKR